MTITSICPNCDKKYSLKDKWGGKKVKCACGCVFRISTEEHRINEDETKQLPEISRVRLQEKSVTQESPSSKEQDAGEGGKKNIRGMSRYDEGHVGNVGKERSMFGHILIRLGYASPGLVGLFILLLIFRGLYFAILVTMAGTVAFMIVMYKGISVFRERAAAEGMTFHQYSKHWAKTEKTPKLKLTEIIVYVSMAIILSLRFMPNPLGAKILTEFSFAQHWKVALLVLGLNFPVLLFIGSWLFGSWKRYLAFNGRLFLWGLLPLHFFFKGYWKIATEMSKDELFAMGATGALYWWICLLEYLAIKVVFLN